jgi:hypothetical protein
VLPQIVAFSGNFFSDLLELSEVRKHRVEMLVDAETSCALRAALRNRAPKPRTAEMKPEFPPAVSITRTAFGLLFYMSRSFPAR